MIMEITLPSKYEPDNRYVLSFASKGNAKFLELTRAIPRNLEG